MKYFFVELLTAYDRSRLLGGSPVLNGVKAVAEKHAVRNGIGPVGKWTGEEPYTASPKGDAGITYSIYSNEVAMQPPADSD